MLILTLARANDPANGSAVNCAPWSVFENLRAPLRKGSLQRRDAERRPPADWKAPGSSSWLAYFDSNATASDRIPWDDAHDVLTVDEQMCIESSIAKFQLGECSEGHSLLKFAAAFADELGEQRPVSVTRRFIKEEQKHALMLKRFMQNHGMRTLQRNWTDTVFRRLRKYAGYEASITVLITAELIALVYYRALQACTQSQVLIAICRRILEEEAAHTRYESELLRFVRERRAGFLRHVPEALHRILYAGTIVVVYVDHHRVLRQGGYRLFAFWSACWGCVRERIRQNRSKVANRMG